MVLRSLTFHMEFWKLLGGAVVLTLSVVAISSQWGPKPRR